MKFRDMAVRLIAIVTLLMIMAITFTVGYGGIGSWHPSPLHDNPAAKAPCALQVATNSLNCSGAPLYATPVAVEPKP